MIFKILKLVTRLTLFLLVSYFLYLESRHMFTTTAIIALLIRTELMSFFYQDIKKRHDEMEKFLSKFLSVGRPTQGEGWTMPCLEEEGDPEAAEKRFALETKSQKEILNNVRDLLRANKQEKGKKSE